MQICTDHKGRIVGLEDVEGIDYIIRWQQEGEDGPYDPEPKDGEAHAIDFVPANFSLVCRHCSADGPAPREAAIAAGWTEIEFNPDWDDRNYNGCCPHQKCRQAEAA